MSSLSIGYSNYSGTSSLLQTLSEQTSSSTSTSTTSSSSTNSQTWRSAINTQINALLDMVPKGDDGKLSFQDVDDYREQLEKDWDEAVKEDFEALGLDPDAEYPLNYDPATGTVTVTKGHPDKAVIDQYFANNPDKVDEFEAIVQLGKLTSASNSTLTQNEMRQSLQQQAMSWWFEDNSDPTSWFSGGGLVLGQQTAYTGLNITV
ncbi:hypothetical protein GM415_08610 [Pseudodesulfovibrio cashew]|uniref:Uncharacterized protein n=2 Tax=Pseudodesulfovibrio cashew TaxID=2678688 RepID=A0A6I6JLE5_9BACT|nr:hypothetical protein GM415_08610 [Pseudodesulfovibrio cashew]